MIEDPPVTQPQPISPPQETAFAQKTRPRYLIPAASIAVLLVIGGYLIFARETGEQAPPSAVVPITVPSPTPTPNVSRIATTAAFAAFREEVASFSATIRVFNLEDSTLAPPMLDLELGL